MTDAEKYMQIYNQLEQIARQYFYLEDEENSGPKAMRQLQRYSKFARYKNEIDACIEIRNHLTHVKFNKQYTMNPIPSTIEFITKLVELLERQETAYDACVKDVYTTTADDLVLKVMKKMQEETFTHVPVIRDNVIEGVFSENTVFEYMADTEITCLDDMRISDFNKYLPLGNHAGEVFKFVERSLHFYEIYQLFQESLQNKDRIGMVFVTETGKQTEKLLGVLTVWDVLGSECME